MFSHRGLFLAVTISLTNIALADVLVQPGYEHYSNPHYSNQHYSDPRYLEHQSVSQHWIRSPTEQYRTEQLPNQESTRYLSGVQTVYPYESNQARSHVLSYPHRSSYHHYLPRPHHVHFARIGGHGYVRPSVYVGHPQSLTVHNRRKRSDPTSTESSKSEIVAHDNDVAAKSPLTDAKHLTTIDSLLREHEPTDITDKRVENRQIKNDYITNPRSFGFYTEDTHPEHTYNIPNTWQRNHKYEHGQQGRAKLGQDQIPFYFEMTPEASQYPSAPYDTNDRPCPNYNYNYLYNYPRYWLYDWGNAEGMKDFFIQFKKNDTTSTKHAPDPNKFYPSYGRMHML